MKSRTGELASNQHGQLSRSFNMMGDQWQIEDCANISFHVNLLGSYMYQKRQTYKGGSEGGGYPP